MTRTEFDELVQANIRATADLLIAKGAEYAGDGDRLANFKRNAEKQGTTPLQIWKQYYGKHVDAVDTYFQRVNEGALEETARMISMTAWQGLTGAEVLGLINASVPAAMGIVDSKLSEPIEGRLRDIINYCFLGIALLQETRK